MNAREEILSRLKPTVPGPAAIGADALLIAPERPFVDATALEEGFVAKLSLPSIAATHDRIDTLADLPAAILRYCIEQGLPPALYLPPDARLSGCDWSPFAVHEAAATEEPVVLAVARCGIAETGSLVFETAPDAPMLPNFVALHHIVLLEADRIVAHLEEATLPGPQPRAHYWVTGVSGTTDIEGTYVRGAHGPRFLHVILVRAALPRR
ncbi:LUD domain-containing protein [Sphingomonas sp. BIUV-7]|uniref:LUD domain-containing protein n=1 Tax=Sphingomonas natans TaxID=3063330 RepID=A0ABT8Y3G5_9SPHN|nr:LUD domain-containing protein [Sphingomonas sp. BIUV-7]MDO6412850.1 LUD domain-containing protein [Sphingomonas sp. BIUV-7]